MEMVRLVGEAEVVRKKERSPHGFGRFLGRVRSVFAFLLVATVLVFAFCHSADLQNYVVSNLYKWSQVEFKSDSLRQNALKHENEVNRVLE